MRAAAIVISGLILTCRASLADTPPAAPPAGTPPPTSATDEHLISHSVWHVAADGNLTHLQSGLICDLNMGAYHRTDVLAFNPNGLDVGCNYASDSDGTITIYITRRGTQTVADDFAEARREMLQRVAGLTLLPDSSSKRFSSDLGWEWEIYAWPNGKWWEGVWIADLHGWTLEYRVSMTPQSEQAVLSELAVFTARAEQSAGAQLSVCAKSQLPVRDGVAVADKKEIEDSLMMASLLSVVNSDPSKSLAKPMIWCVEGEAGQGAPFLIWHAVFDDGSDASADRITPITQQDALPITSEPDKLLGLVENANKDHPNTKERWMVKLVDGGKTWIYGMFDGRPASGDLLAVGQALIAGKAKLLGGYSYKNNKLSISMPPSDDK